MVPRSTIADLPAWRQLAFEMEEAFGAPMAMSEKWLALRGGTERMERLGVCGWHLTSRYAGTRAVQPADSGAEAQIASPLSSIAPVSRSPSPEATACEAE